MKVSTTPRPKVIQYLIIGDHGLPRLDLSDDQRLKRLLRRYSSSKLHAEGHCGNIMLRFKEIVPNRGWCVDLLGGNQHGAYRLGMKVKNIKAESRKWMCLIPFRGLGADAPIK